MNRERLQQMVTMLRNLPAEKLDMSEWHCGTTACAVGHACLDPVFNKQGLVLSDWGAPSFRGEDGWQAVRDFFGINWPVATHFFDIGEYEELPNPTPNDVADRIEYFLATSEV